ncbi:MAG: molybdopterin-dependent oxidoreductase, partial [Dehalococcoidia bacterium]|nr:molybdopterin-dependent oxidoreductase [Dehalococcoidia bacterium]
MARNVVGKLENRDKHTYEILTGKFQYYADQCCGKRYFGAIKTADCAKGSVNMVGPGGRLDRITIEEPGEGYDFPPTVTIPGGAVATASIFDGKVVLINIIQRGNGYSTPPTVSFSGGNPRIAARASATITLLEPDIDFSRALEVKGVRAVLNHLDARGNYGSNVCLTQTFTYWGAPVAAVVADDWHTALYACGLIKVNYTPLPWVTSPYDAMDPDSPPAGSASVNLQNPSTTVRPSGTTATQIEQAYSECLYKAEHEQDFTTCYAHNMLEPHGNTAWWIGDHVYCWTGTQNLHSAHSTFYGQLNRGGTLVPTVHSFSQGTGGGHGDKNSAPNMGLTARMSLMVGGAPVTLIETRNTNITTHARQSGTKQSIRIGAKTRGAIDVYDASAILCGASGGSAQCDFTGIQQSFTIPTYRHVTQALYTNTPARGSYRCVGDPPSCLAYDSAIDRLAEKMNMSPYELRMNNLRDSHSPAATGYNAYRGLELKVMLKKLYDESGYASKWHAPKARDIGSKKHGIALTCHVDGHGNVNGSGRRMSMVANAINNTPHFYINVGFGRGPSGAPSAMASIVAERVGVGYDNVHATDAARTDRSLDSSMQAGSRFTAGAGGAAYNMADKARTEILTLALANAVFTGINDSIPADRKRAVATANVVDGRITSFTVTDQGDGYTGAPRVTISATGGGSGATAVAYVTGGKLVSLGVTNPGSGYTASSVITVNIGWLSIEDLDPKENVIYVNEGLPVPSSTSYPLAIGGLLPNTSLGWQGIGYDLANTQGSCGTCAELTVDTETGEIEMLGIWNVIETGGTIFRRGAIKEMLSGAELIMAATLFFGDIYDHWHKGALIGTQYSQSQVPTSMDLPC